MGVSKQELVYSKIKDDIINSVLFSGDALMEQKLCDYLSVSRTPVRAALLKLEREGFVKSVPNRGVFVSEINIKDILDIYELREVMDPLALRLALRKRKSEVMENMDYYLTQHKIVVADAEKNNDWQRVLSIDNKFHAIYLESCGNSQILNAYHQFKDKALWYMHTRYRDGKRAVESLDQHERVVDAVRRDEHLKAEKLLAEHMASIRQYYVELMI